MPSWTAQKLSGKDKEAAKLRLRTLSNLWLKLLDKSQKLMLKSLK